MFAYIPIKYPARPNDDQQEQWRNAAHDLAKSGVVFYIHIMEYLDGEDVCQVCVVKENKKINIKVCVMLFLHSFKAHAPFVKIGKAEYADTERIEWKEIFRMCYDMK